MVGNYYNLGHPSLVGTRFRTQFYSDYPGSPWSRRLKRDDVDIDMNAYYRIHELVVVYNMIGRRRRYIKYVAAKS